MPDIIFNGPEGRLEGKYTTADKSTAPCVLVLHPHPQLGGTMNNKVVYHTYHSFVRNGFTAMRFNFRGVGRSAGSYDNGVGELSDAASAMDWLQLNNPDSNSFWVAGFSFGSWIAMQLLMRRPEIRGFVAVAPPVPKFDFNFLYPCPASGLIIQGNADSVVSVDHVTSLYDRLSKQKNVNVDYEIIDGGDHFFRTRMDKLVFTMENYIKRRLEEIVEPMPIKVKAERKRRVKAF